MRKIYFVTGIGTGVGKTIASALLTEALQADYWKPVQAGLDETDSDRVRSLVSNSHTVVHPELYRLEMGASPHIAARNEGLFIDPDLIVRSVPGNNRTLIIEGAGGLFVPLNDHQFVSDLISKLDCQVVLVSRNYLGSINHSLLTAAHCREKNLSIAGWIFNDQYLHYEEEIVAWSGFPHIASIPYSVYPDKQFIKEQAEAHKQNFARLL